MRSAPSRTSSFLELFHDVMRPRHDSRYHGYAPQDLTVPARYAAYSANLVILIILVGEPVNCDTLFPGGRPR